MYSGAEKITSLAGGCQPQLLITACLHLPSRPVWIKMQSKFSGKRLFFLLSAARQKGTLTFKPAGMMDSPLAHLSGLTPCGTAASYRPTSSLFCSGSRRTRWQLIPLKDGIKCYWMHNLSVDKEMKRWHYKVQRTSCFPINQDTDERWIELWLPPQLLVCFLQILIGLKYFCHLFPSSIYLGSVCTSVQEEVDKENQAWRYRP